MQVLQEERLLSLPTPQMVELGQAGATPGEYVLFLQSCSIMHKLDGSSLHLCHLAQLLLAQLQVLLGC